jgi:hypothetical protein
MPAQLRNLSTSGALVGVEQPCPPLTRMWICLAGQEVIQWVHAEVLESISDEDDRGSIRLKFPEVFPYEGFKAAVWGDTHSRRRLSGSGSEPPPQAQTSTPTASPRIGNGEMSEEDRLRFFLEIESAPPSAIRPVRPVEHPPSSHPPTLVDARREQMVLNDRVAHFPWLTKLVLCLIVALMLAVLVGVELENLRRLGMFLGWGA